MLHIVVMVSKCEALASSVLVQEEQREEARGHIKCARIEACSLTEIQRAYALGQLKVSKGELVFECAGKKVEYDCRSVQLDCQQLIFIVCATAGSDW